MLVNLVCLKRQTHSRVARTSLLLLLATDQRQARQQVATFAPGHHPCSLCVLVVSVSVVFQCRCPCPVSVSGSVSVSVRKSRVGPTAFHGAIAVALGGGPTVGVRGRVSDDHYLVNVGTHAPTLCIHHSSGSAHGGTGQ